MLQRPIRPNDSSSTMSRFLRCLMDRAYKHLADWLWIFLTTTSLILGVFTNSVPEVCKCAKEFVIFANTYATMFYSCMVALCVCISDYFVTKAMLFVCNRYAFTGQQHAYYAIKWCFLSSKLNALTSSSRLTGYRNRLFCILCAYRFFLDWKFIRVVFCPRFW